MIPKISVITPSYNQGEFLEETIRSVIEQDYPNLEYIVIDGGSSDNSVEIIKEYSGKITHWVSERDSGQTHAINKGLHIATGDILCWINSDDCFTPGALKCVAQYLVDIEMPVWMVASCEVIDSLGKHLYFRETKELSIKNFIRWEMHWLPQQSIFWTRGMVNHIGMLDQSLTYAMDYEYWIRMYTQSQPIIKNIVLSKYRYHNRAKCITNSAGMLLEIEQVKNRLKINKLYAEMIDYLTSIEYELDQVRASRFWKIRNTIMQFLNRR